MSPYLDGGSEIIHVKIDLGAVLSSYVILCQSHGATHGKSGARYSEGEQLMGGNAHVGGLEFPVEHLGVEFGTWATFVSALPFRHRALWRCIPRATSFAAIPSPAGEPKGGADISVVIMGFGV